MTHILGVAIGEETDLVSRLISPRLQETWPCGGQWAVCPYNTSAKGCQHFARKAPKTSSVGFSAKARK